MAREAREAANDPAARRNPPLREQIKSPSYWLSLLAMLVAILLFNARSGWVDALGAVLYLGGLVAGPVFRARTARLLRTSTKEPGG